VKTALACLLWLIASVAIAAPRVSLIALSPSGERAVLTYDQDWVEIRLRRGEADAQALKPPLGCRWTSMAYAPTGDKLAMIAFCPAESGVCRDVQSLLLTAGSDRLRYELVAERMGARWGRIYWRGGGAEVVALEAQMTVPMATNLADLGKTIDECVVAPPQLVSLNMENGRRIRLDLIPKDWRMRRIVAAGPRDMIAEIAIRRDGPPEISAAAQLDAICAASPKNNLCRSSNVAVELLWRNGDWRFASPPDQVRLGRMVASADLSVIGRERCEARWVENQFRPLCVIQFERTVGQDSEVTAPDGMFGDLALSADGRWMLAVATGIGRRLRQFDLFDTETGKRQTFPHLLLLAPPFTGAKAAER
jgi:hypothetical protein